MKLIGISGSLRKESFNTKMLHAVASCLPEGVTITFISCGDLPLYNTDIDGEKKPESVVQFKNSIAGCDGLLFSTPEYNYSIPGLLKNAIDWASRPAYKSVLAGKPVAILSGSKSPVGGARVQSHLRDILSATLSPVVPSPPFLIPQAHDKFDDEGKLTDPASLQRLERYIGEFVDWVACLAKR